jgi:hypothetical protein
MKDEIRKKKTKKKNVKKILAMTNYVYLGDFQNYPELANST